MTSDLLLLSLQCKWGIKMKNRNVLMSLLDGLRQWVKINFLLFTMTFILRLLFFFVLLISNNIEWSSFPIVLSGVYFDLFLVMRVTALLVLPFLLLHLLLPKTAYIIGVAFITVYCILYGGLIGYYNNVMLPLDEVFFVFKAGEMIDIIVSSVKFSILPLLGVLVMIALYVLLLVFWKRKVFIGNKTAIPYMIVSIVFSVAFNYKSLTNNDTPYKSYSDFCLASNQMVYTLNAFDNYFKNNESNAFDKYFKGKKSVGKNDLQQYDFYDKEILKTAKDYHLLFPEFTYVDSLYPFMRVFDDKDVLGSFFNKTSDGLPPNFVFVIVEGMGQNLTDFNPKMSYTPFIDSLSSCGLYWHNCLALAERTFGALPNIFSSTPYDKTGFARPWFPIPDHNSLLKDMSKNGYSISYYYGGNAAFDGQDEYLLNNGVSYIMRPLDDELDYENKETMQKNNAWGLYDGDMFKLAVNHKDSVGTTRPYTDIYLTLTTHEPFDFKGIEEYEKRVLQMLDSNTEVPDKERKRIIDNKNVYACFLYLDDCVRMLFDYYKRLPDFENTVFVILGDHRMGRLYVNASELLKYNVPLIIYSPLLKSPKTFGGVVTHHDITPSINSYLKNNYDYRIDSLCHWLGTSFDTSAVFSSKVKVPFMRNNREVIEYMYNDLFVVRNRLFRVGPDMYPTEISDSTLLNKMLKYLSDYKKIDHYVTQNDYLVPKPFDEMDNVVSYNFEMNKPTPTEDNQLLYGLRLNTEDNTLEVELHDNEYLHVFSPIIFDKDYQKIYIDMVCEYKMMDKSKVDDFIIIFKMNKGNDLLMYKGYNVNELTSDIIDDKDGFKRLRVKTTCFFPKPVTKDAVMKMYLLLKEKDATMKIKYLDINIDALPVE